MDKKIRIALAGNPNSGKTTLFNALTGSNQYVGNWPGVTVEKKEGALKGHSDVVIVDLPGIYSLSPYTLEEVVARTYLTGERPEVILNIVDASNLERNLYLTGQLMELGLPLVVALNMMDVVRRRGDKIDTVELSRKLRCPVIEISALKGENISEAAEAALAAVKAPRHKIGHPFSGEIEHAIAHIEEAVLHDLPEAQQRWYAVKLFERDSKIREELALPQLKLDHIEADIVEVETEADDDAESIIANERYLAIAELLRGCYKKARAIDGLSTSDKIDRVVTNRILALPIFFLIMWGVYTISMGTVGDWTVGFMNDKLFGEWIIPPVINALEKWQVAPWLISLIGDGILGGLGAVLGFVPQLMILFAMLSILEDVGYMARVAFIMDRIFRKFGLSGKSFIPMLVASGCGVPAVMASRTIEQERDRRMTIMTTCFIPCGAKMPIVAMIAGALFGGSAWIATSAYFAGVAAVVISGVVLKKFQFFAGVPAPFVMELPSYHPPVVLNVLRTTWERGWSFIVRAGTVIVAAGIILWVLQSFSFEGGLHYIGESGGASVLSVIGGWVAVLFKPLGFGDWQAVVATITGLIAKEAVVGTFGSLSSIFAKTNPEAAADLLGAMEGEVSNLTLIGQEFFRGSKLAAYSFLIFNLLCAPCFAAMGAIRREMNNSKWTAAAIGYMTGFAYAVSLVIYQLGRLAAGHAVNGWSCVAFAIVAIFIYLIFRRQK